MLGPLKMKKMCERSGRPDVTSRRTTRESQPGFSQEETEHDGTAQVTALQMVNLLQSERDVLAKELTASQVHHLGGLVHSL